MQVKPEVLLVTLSNNDVAVFLNARSVYCLDSSEEGASPNDVAANIATSLHIQVQHYFMDVPSDSDWTWNDVYELLPIPQSDIETFEDPEAFQRLRLVLDVDFEMNGVPVAVLQENFMALVTNAFENGALTGTTNAEVMMHSCEVIPMLMQQRALLDEIPNQENNDYAFAPDAPSCWITIDNTVVYVYRNASAVTVEISAKGILRENVQMASMTFAAAEADICADLGKIDLDQVAIWANKIGVCEFDSLKFEQRARLIRQFADEMIREKSMSPVSKTVNGNS